MPARTRKKRVCTKAHKKRRWPIPIWCTRVLCPVIYTSCRNSSRSWLLCAKFACPIGKRVVTGSIDSINLCVCRNAPKFGSVAKVRFYHNFDPICLRANNFFVQMQISFVLRVLGKFCLTPSFKLVFCHASLASLEACFVRTLVVLIPLAVFPRPAVS